MINRRGLITGLISLIAAPAIVRAESLMKCKSIRLFSNDEIINSVVDIWSKSNQFIDEYAFLYGEQWTKLEIDTMNGIRKFTKIELKDIYLDTS